MTRDMCPVKLYTILELNSKRFANVNACYEHIHAKRLERIRKEVQNEFDKRKSKLDEKIAKTMKERDPDTSCASHVHVEESR